MKRRAHGITLVVGANNLASGLAQERIVHRHHQRALRWQGLFNLLTDLVEHRILIKTIQRIEPVISRPVVLVTVLGPQQRTDGMPAKADQLSQQVTPSALKALGGAKDILQRTDQPLELLEECGVFFSVIAVGGTALRERIRCPRSAMVHWTSSPLEKSMA